MVRLPIFSFRSTFVLPRFLSFLLIMCALSVSANAIRALATEFVVGRSFPDLWLPAAEDGRATTVSAWRGQKIMLHLFASW